MKIKIKKFRPHLIGRYYCYENYNPKQAYRIVGHDKSNIKVIYMGDVYNCTGWEGVQSGAPAPEDISAVIRDKSDLDESYIIYDK